MANLINFVTLLNGKFDNKDQFEKISKTNPQYPYAKHINTICNSKIANLPNGFEGVFMIEESYYSVQGTTRSSSHLFLFMVVTNADNMQYENSRVYNIDRIVLGYARIYEPSTDAHTGILIPVWDFFGSMTSESEYNGETESNTSKDPNESFLTINAVDGSIIDRNLGY